MKTKELITKLSRLQSRAYNLQFDIQKLIAELDSEELVKDIEKINQDYRRQKT